ncbi:hypothetical protein HMY34_03240 [Thiothrix subterranea]|uniref:hypothetical protein n=1 Tax=Thiothrix subterranea TaxID=2735563 RepID=UPI00192CB4BA|nr:hypothetical protein [Thiothrix subterranea]QQZ27846.1 hypothetical protein HMY34_03240 [Thiothrix subterranea]
MNLVEFYKEIDNRREDQILENFDLVISPKAVIEIHKELSTKSVSEIPPQYRADVQKFLESSLILPDAENQELDNYLSKLLSDLREIR